MRPGRAPRSGGPFEHVGVPYGSDEGFLDLAVPRVRHALTEGRRVLVVTCRTKGALLAEALGDDSRRVDLRDRTAWYGHPQRTLATVHEYARGRRTLLIGEPPWTGRDEIGVREWIRYESVINTALAGLTAGVLCFYDVRATPGHVLRHVAMTHPLMFGPGGVEPSQEYVHPDDLILNGDTAPLPEPSGEVIGIPFDARLLKELRGAVARQAGAWGMEDELVTSLVLSVSEIAANSIEHGAGHGLVRMWRTGGGLVCEITDSGGPLEEPLPGYIPPEPESQRGYGLWISRQLCDLVELRSEGELVRVRLHMRLRS
ncbi:anti-sigma factor RsbA family regulatory protein [Nonomuraea sp. NPDC048826]|uniref:anti-sigma factor RsbA family regulatory protein n=1 Tax=Nonomuraea sp. NPDC048826 TaxID=3364347 RepID=UPI0037185F42